MRVMRSQASDGRKNQDQKQQSSMCGDPLFGHKSTIVIGFFILSNG
jgi:hypothetical protein